MTTLIPSPLQDLFFLYRVWSFRPLQQMPPTRPLLTRGRIAWTCTVLVIITSWFALSKWRALPYRTVRLDDRPAARNGSHSATDHTLGRLAAWFPQLQDSTDSNGQRTVSAHNARSLRELLSCMQARDCEKNQVRQSFSSRA